MTDTYDLILQGGTVVNQDGEHRADVGVKDGKTAFIGKLDAGQGGEVIECTGLHILPGVIDSQVHMREPGMEEKEDLEAGGRAAVLGGVTAVFEMPNTKPNTTTSDALADKVRRGTDRMFCDFAFYVGGTAENAETLPELENEPGCCGVKVFMGSSTGTLLVADDGGVRHVLQHGRRRVAFHSEDEFRLRERRELAVFGDVKTHPVWRDVEAAVMCTKRLLSLAQEVGRRIHVLHISTAEELPILAQHKDVATVEATPQHLTLAAPDCYDELGTFAQMNPPIRDARHREGLWNAVAQGIVDVVATDHAPHLKHEKEQAYPKSPSGMPGVQTFVPIMLDHINAGRLTLERFVDLACHGPQRVFGVAGKGRLAVGYDADFTVVDMQKKTVIQNEWIASKCGWTPYAGKQVTGWPKGTIIRGRKVMWEDEILGAAGGRAVRFQETLGR